MIVAAMLFIMSAHASPSAYFSASYAGGGESLHSFTGGPKYDVTAGSGVGLSMGAIVPVVDTEPHSFEAQLGIGYTFIQSGDEDLVTFRRIPIEAIYFYRNRRNEYRLGWGAVYHVGSKIIAEGSRSGAERRIDNALGWVVAAEKRLETWYVGVRYQNMKYDMGEREADASAWQVTMTVPTN